MFKQMLEKIKKPHVISLLIFSIGLIVFASVAIIKLRPQSNNIDEEEEQELELSAEDKQKETDEPTVTDHPSIAPTLRPTIVRSSPAPTIKPSNTPTPTDQPSSTPTPEPTQVSAPSSTPTTTLTNTPTPVESPKPTTGDQ